MLIKKPKLQLGNPNNFFRDLGYAPLEAGQFAKPSRGYPRFHIYIKEGKDNYLINLHLDQKRPSYGKYTAHSGEYNSETVKIEAKRIMSY